MSVIVAKSTYCCPGTYTTSTQCIPVIFNTRLIPPSQTLTVDQIDTTLWNSARWEVVVNTTSSSMAYEIHATRNQVSNVVSFNVYSMLGDIILHVPAVSAVAGNLVLSILNNELVNIEVYVSRIAVPVSQYTPVVYSFVTVAKSTQIVSPTVPTILDNLPISDVACKWIVSITDAMGDRSIFSVYGVRTQTYSSNNAYGVIGSTSSYTFAVTHSTTFGVGMQLVLTNNTASGCRVDITRIPVYSQPSLSAPFCANTNNQIELWNPTPVLIPTLTTSTVDTNIDISIHKGVSWILHTLNQTSGQTASCEISCTVSSTLVPSWSSYSIVGDVMGVTITCTVLGSYLRLHVTNSDSVGVLATLIRVPVSI